MCKPAKGTSCRVPSERQCVGTAKPMREQSQLCHPIAYLGAAPEAIVGRKATLQPRAHCNKLFKLKYGLLSGGSGWIRHKCLGHECLGHECLGHDSVQLVTFKHISVAWAQKVHVSGMPYPLSLHLEALACKLIAYQRKSNLGFPLPTRESATVNN